MLELMPIHLIVSISHHLLFLHQGSRLMANKAFLLRVKIS